MKTFSTLLFSGLASLALLTTGCFETNAGQGAAIGGAGGAAAGAIIGNQSGNAGMGAVIGGAGGAVTGAIIGKAKDDKQNAHY
jgi:hypothetical protein